MEILTLGEKIKAKRKEMNMTLKDLAEDRVTPGQISLVESGKSKPSIDLLEYIAERLNTDIEYFLETEEKQATRICEFYSNIAEAAVNAENMLRAKEAIEKGVHYAQKYNLNYFKGKFDMAFAYLKYNNKEFEESQQYCISANSIFLKTESIEDIIKSFILLGIITLDMGYVSTALNYFMQADSILNEYNLMDEILKARIYYYIASCQSRMGNMSQAIDYSLLVKDRLKLLTNKREYAETLMILSIAYSQENKVKEALKYAREARKIFDEINDVHEIANIETNLGVIFAKGHNMDESFEHLNEALKLKREINDETIPDTLLKICDNYIQMNEFDNALEVAMKTMDSLEDEQHKYRIKCYEYMFKIYNKKNDRKKAEETLLNAIKYLESLDFTKQLADFYVVTGKFYMEIGEKELALGYINKGLDMYKNLGIILSE
jgi:transcriptional regulator with XRE-family HTH domain/microcompartment protein CcmL/EutN